MLACFIDRHHPGAIQQLYTGIGCSSCGLRFKSDAVDKYTEHLDWHFRQNRREKEEIKVAKYRQWYYDIVVCFLDLIASQQFSVICKGMCMKQ